MHSQVKKIANLVQKYLDKQVKVYNGLTGEILEYGDSYEDLGDYIPFFAYLGKTDVVQNELQKAIARLKKRNHIYHKTEDVNIFDKCCIKSYDQQDLLFGLLLQSKEDKTLLPVAQKVYAAWKRLFFGKKSANAVLGYIPLTTIKIPPVVKLNLLSSKDHGFYIELAVLLYQQTKDKQYLNDAYELYNRLIKSHTFAKKGYFAFYEPQDWLSKIIIKKYVPISRHTGVFQLLKPNSNTVMGILALYKQTRDNSVKQTLIQLMDKWLTLFYDEKKGIFYTDVNYKKQTKCARLTCFHIIDILIEYYQQFSDEKYLQIAQAIAESFLQHRAKETGLLPIYHPDTQNDFRQFKHSNATNWIDTTVDFATALIRLSSVCKKNYVSQAKELLDSIVKYQFKKYGFVESIDIHTKEIISPKYSLKNSALVLKGFIAIQEHKAINDKYYYLLQDR